MEFMIVGGLFILGVVALFRWIDRDGGVNGPGK